MYIDSHCHLNLMVKKDFDLPLKSEDFSKVSLLIENAVSAGVEKIINVGTSLVESINTVEIAKQFEQVFAVVGIHPCDAKETWKKDLGEIKKLIKDKEFNKIVGIGEIGLDFYHKPFNKQRQIDAFKAQIELALENSLPIVVHVRSAVDEVIKVLEEYALEVKGVNHCFQHERYVADAFLGWGFFLGINAPITYPKNEQFRELLKDLPIESLFLETDAPFLPPQEFRGKQNHPKYIPLIAQALADIKGIPLDDVADITTSNVESLFFI
ncbi:TatD family hydrolase [Candidatus Babeliales bacterium]|nr:TatD family hydrolase [Candidatus Babeliales bacterium]